MDFLTVNLDDAANQLLRERVRSAASLLRTPINITQYDWDDVWHEAVNVGIYRRGADVAEIGSTWLESLVEMNALDAFSPQEINRYGGKQDFFPSVWQNLTAGHESQVWAIPFRADIRLIFYWKDLFEQAGVDDAEAVFSSADSIKPAFRQLVSKGIPTPWGVPIIRNARNTVYNIASWIWGMGGNFISANARAMELNTPAARKGIRSYFELSDFIPWEGNLYNDLDVLGLFARRKIAATICGSWIFNALRQNHVPESMIERLGVALPPGPAFVGGTALVAWQHSRFLREAKEFIGYLSDAGFQKSYSRLTGLLPVRQASWDEEFLRSNKFMPIYLRALQEGRGLPPIALWGMIEDRLAKTFGAIWGDIVSSSPPVDGAVLDVILDKHLEPLVDRLNITMKN